MLTLFLISKFIYEFKKQRRPVNQFKILQISIKSNDNDVELIIQMNQMLLITNQQ
jgi:hypothetical protein